MKQLLLVLACAVLIPSLMFAQAGGSASNTATFNIGTPLTVAAGATPGDWGELAPGTTYTISADGYIVPPDVNGLTEVPQVVLWTITGQSGATVNISFALPPFFASATGANVPYSVNTMSAGWANTAFAAGTAYNPIDPRVVNSMTLVNNGVGGEADVQIGGILNVPLGANGTYTGTFVLTAQYTGL